MIEHWFSLISCLLLHSESIYCFLDHAKINQMQVNHTNMWIWQMSKQGRINNFSLLFSLAMLSTFHYCEWGVMLNSKNWNEENIRTRETGRNLILKSGNSERLGSSFTNSLKRHVGYAMLSNLRVSTYTTSEYSHSHPSLLSRKLVF